MGDAIPFDMQKQIDDRIKMDDEIEYDGKELPSLLEEIRNKHSVEAEEDLMAINGGPGVVDPTIYEIEGNFDSPESDIERFVERCNIYEYFNGKDFEYIPIGIERDGALMRLTKSNMSTILGKIKQNLAKI